jgi:hypothetical protein
MEYPQRQRDEAVRIGTFGAAAMIYAARSLGLGSTPMIGFDAEASPSVKLHVLIPGSCRFPTKADLPPGFLLLDSMLFDIRSDQQSSGLRAETARGGHTDVE